MVLLIPVDDNNFEDTKIVSLSDLKFWAVVEMEQGYIKKQTFYDSRDKIDEYIEYVIVKSKDDDVEEFLDEGISVLIAPLQIYAEDVIEAYKFRELYEL